MKVKHHLKHLFIPHEHNEYKPHFFREVSIFIIILIIFFLLGVSAGSSFILRKTVLGANVTADVLVDLSNESRLAYGDSPLTRSELLDKAATLKGYDMAAYSYFSHNSPTGITPWYWFKQVGYNFLYAGENLAINFTDATEVRNAWLESPTHRANLLDTRFKEIGMATISGTYEDQPTIYVVQLFGTPAATKTTVTDEQDSIQEPSESSKEAIMNAPEIKGATKTNKTITTATTSAPVDTPLTPIMDDHTFAMVKNASAQEIEAPAPAEYKKYSNWLENALFGGTYYVDIMLKVLFGIILIALGVMLAIEIRRQHWKHAVYGMSVLLIIFLSIIVNQMFW